MNEGKTKVKCQTSSSGDDKQKYQETTLDQEKTILIVTEKEKGTHRKHILQHGSTIKHPEEHQTG